MKMSREYQTFKKILVAISNLDTLKEAAERVQRNKGAITVTQLNHRPASTIGRPAVKSPARIYSGVGRY